jgi:hypothetical protein
MSSKLPSIIKRQDDGSYTVHDEIIHFIDGSKRYVRDVKWIWENEFTHLVTENNTEIIVNKRNVNFIQRYLGHRNDDL